MRSAKRGALDFDQDLKVGFVELTKLVVECQPLYLDQWSHNTIQQMDM